MRSVGVWWVVLVPPFLTAGYRDDELIADLAERATNTIYDFGPQNIANLVWATATLGYKCDSLHAAIEAASLRSIENFSTQEFAIANLG